MEDVLYLGKADAKGLDFTPSPVNFASLCENIINGFEMLPENERRIIAHITGTMPQRLWLDEKLLRHILTNLLSNALKYSLPEQSVDIHIHYMPEKEAEYGTEKSEGMLRLSVKDYGIGIAEEDLRHLFEPFYRASNVGNISGTGLGLAIVKQAVEAHHGYITCESDIERGTEFALVIPCKVS
jgi:signal transduction histidine kinase